MNKLSFSLFVITVFLSLLGVFILYESSSYTALLNIGDRYFFIKFQSIWIILGVILALLVSRIKQRILYFAALPLLLSTLALLVLVFIPGIGLELKGSRRWIDLGFMVFQPSELLKVSLTLYLAAWFSVKEKGRLLAFLILLSVCTGLVIVQPDLGTTFIIALTSVIVYFVSGARIKEMVLIALIFVVGIFFFIKLEPYRLARFVSFQNFDANDISTASYHLKQIVIALGSGGFTGVGFGNSIQKYAYLPENTTDSIFAIFAEEAGFVGSFFLITLFLAQLSIGLIIATSAKDTFGKLLASGIIVFLATQTVVNIASQAILIPLTGVPLPFISYGGSSMVINYIAIGLILNVARMSKKL